jgi:pyruvate dehydrogenase E1 component alpha subunit
MGTSQERSSAGGLGKRAEAYDMKFYICGGHDIYEVRATLDAALTRAREESKPAVVEIDTYRYRGHSVADPDKTYRDRAEIEDYRKTKDPIQVFENQLISEKVLTPALIEEIDAAARAESERAVEFAEASPFPTVADIQKDVYWETDQPKRTSEGRIFFNQP